IYPRSNTSWSSPTALPHRLKTGRHPGGRAIGRRPPPPTRGFSPPLTVVPLANRNSLKALGLTEFPEVS
ncbi:MAG TPA: hypothetical protein VND19_16405, partial [Acetobacteraceae bacterium]|nr:hypothetical protein [Acetobacteraceae bacterium]